MLQLLNGEWEAKSRKPRQSENSSHLPKLSDLVFAIRVSGTFDPRREKCRRIQVTPDDPEEADLRDSDPLHVNIKQASVPIRA